MQRPILSTTGLLFIALFVSACFFLAGPEGEIKVLQQSPLPTATPGGPTPLPTPEFCISATHDCVLLEFMGYVQNGDGTTTLNYRITNNCVDEVEYFAIETGLWSRDTPADGSSYSGDLGAHAVSWVDEQQGIPTQGVRFDNSAANFKEGAAEVYTFTVRDFTPRSPNTGRVVVGERELAFRMMLLDPACEIGINPTPRPTPTAPFSPLPTPTPIPVGYTLPTEPIVPECVFEPPAGGLPPDEPVIPLSAYSFSEPTLVLTHTAPIGIEQWLPDSETLMVTRRESMDDHYYSVELVNALTGEMNEIVEPQLQLKEPKWLSLEQTVMWREIRPPWENEAGYWAQSLEPFGRRRLSENATGASIAHDSSPDNKEFVFMLRPAGTQPFIWNQETKEMRALPIDLNNWRYQNGPIYPVRPFNVNWKPDGNKLLFWDGTWTFLYDLATNRGCEIATGLYAREVSWSPNGRYLLIQIGEHLSSHHPPHNLVQILDTYTGERMHHSLDVPVSNFSWAPDNQTVAITGLTGEEIENFGVGGYYLFNVHSGDFQRILNEQRTLIGRGSMVDWSSNGNLLALQCMDTVRDLSGGTFDRICTSLVITNQ